MPIYEYCCKKCNTVFERFKPISESGSDDVCPCGAPAKRIISNFKTEKSFAPFYHEGLDKVVTSQRDMQKEMSRQKVVPVIDSRKGRNAVAEKIAKVMQKNKNPEFLKKADRFLKSVH